MDRQIEVDDIRLNQDTSEIEAMLRILEWAERGMSDLHAPKTRELLKACRQSLMKETYYPDRKKVI